MLHGFHSYSMRVLPLEAAYAMNSSGVIAGTTGGNAALYREGNVVVLAGMAGYSGLTATAISDNGIIAGHGQSAGHQRPLYWASETAAARDMGAQDRWAWCYAVNTYGVVVLEHRPSQQERGRAFRWSLADGLRAIAPDQTLHSVAVDISESGYMTGYGDYVSDGRHAVRWKPDGGIERIALGYGHQVFEDGSVAGFDAGAAFGRSTLWSPQNAARLIGPYPTSHHVRHTARYGRRAGYTVGVTETGQTGAWTTTQDGEPPVYLPVPAGANGYAYTVSASGAIMGSIKLSNGQDQPVLWTKMTPDVQPPIARKVGSRGRTRRSGVRRPVNAMDEKLSWM
jgi:hypothetical protein